MSETYEYFVRICQSTNPRLSGYGCCMDKGSEEVLQRLIKQLEEEGLGNRVQIRAVNCLRNCHQGVSVQVIPGPVWYGHVGVEDIESLVREHLGEGEPLTHLRVSRPGSLL